MSNLSALLIQGLIRVLGVHTLLLGETGIEAALLGSTLEPILSTTTRVLLRTNLRIEAGVRVLRGEATLSDVLALGLLMLVSVRDVSNVARRLATVVLTRTASWGLSHLLRGLVLASVEVHLLLGTGRAAGVAGLGEVLAGEVTLATQGFGVLLLARSVLAEAADGGGGESGSTGGIGVLQGGVAARDAHGFGTAVLRETAALADGLGGERVVGDGTGALFDGVGCGGVVGDLGTAGAVRKRSALEIHGDCGSM